jgi:hypothetical protein
MAPKHLWKQFDDGATQTARDLPCKQPPAGSVPKQMPHTPPAGPRERSESSGPDSAGRAQAHWKLQVESVQCGSVRSTTTSAKCEPPTLLSGSGYYVEDAKAKILVQRCGQGYSMVLAERILSCDPAVFMNETVIYSALLPIADCSVERAMGTVGCQRRSGMQHTAAPSLCRRRCRSGSLTRDRSVCACAHALRASCSRADAWPFMRVRLRARARTCFCVACLVVACARVCGYAH